MNKALLVGINQYAKQTPLEGCLNDIEDVSRALVARGAVTAGNVVVLADAKATKTAILDELKALIEGLGAGDCGYFHYSGHGVRMYSADPEEPDGMDEVLCPYEFDWSIDTSISDNELLAVLEGLRFDSRMILTFDSCHSGDMARFVLRPNIQPRTLPTPPSVKSARGATRNGFRAAGRAPNISFVSACSPWQVAADTSFDGRANGGFTYYFMKQIGANSAETPLADIVAAIEPALLAYEMTPVAENGTPPYYPAKAGARALTRRHALTRTITSARAGAVVFEQTFHASLLGQDLGVAVRILASNGELTTYLTTRLMGEALASPPIRTTGNMLFPLSLGFFGVRLLLSVSDWQYAPQAIDFAIGLDLASDLPFVPGVRVARLPVHINVAGVGRGLATTQATSPADLLALLTLQQLNRTDAAGLPLIARDAAASAGIGVRGFRDPWIQVLDSDVAKWGPNWREDRVIRPFTNRPRPDGVRRHSVDIGPQRGSGNVYVVGWLSDQETDFDFILHMGNNFFGGWGEIDWRVQGYYADIQPFPRDAARAKAPPAESNGHGRMLATTLTANDH